ncbi:hypothetical protein, partial [Burkholderia humptydooensis]|uniref:hypothetical protein n=1 Tax=Burkholderia humptydooensis TaxID=430531 RepID=UPI001E542DF6
RARLGKSADFAGFGWRERRISSPPGIVVARDEALPAARLPQCGDRRAAIAPVVIRPDCAGRRLDVGQAPARAERCARSSSA